MIVARHAMLEDLPAVMVLAVECAAESQAHRPFNAEKLERVLRTGFETQAPTLFVAEQDGTVIGFQICYAQEHIAFDEVYTVPHTTYVTPRKRGTRAAALLMAYFLRWSDDIGAVENVGGNSNDFQTEQTKRFLQRFGYRVVGYCMARRPARADT